VGLSSVEKRRGVAGLFLARHHQLTQQLTKNVNLTHLCGRFFICFVPNGPEVA
jgi:hypothetical protein